MDLYDKLCTQFSSNLNKHNTTDHLQHPVRHLHNVWSSNLHVVSHTVATAANPARMMNRALKQQATELGPNMWQQQQGIANYDNKVPYFHIPSSQQFASQTAAPLEFLLENKFLYSFSASLFTLYSLLVVASSYFIPSAYMAHRCRQMT